MSVHCLLTVVDLLLGFALVGLYGLAGVGLQGQRLFLVGIGFFKSAMDVAVAEYGLLDVLHSGVDAVTDLDLVV